MFTVGQRVWHRNGQRSGTVLECDGDLVFIAQDNGAELDFPASELSATPPGARPTAVATAVAAASPNRLLSPRDITPEHARVLEAVPIRTLREVASLFERRPGAGRFSSLDLAAKLNAIAEITAVPYRTMKQFSDRPGELGLLMGKGLADRRNAGT